MYFIFPVCLLGSNNSLPIYQQGVFMKSQKVTLVVKSDIKAGPPMVIKREN